MSDREMNTINIKEGINNVVMPLRTTEDVAYIEVLGPNGEFFLLDSLTPVYAEKRGTEGGMMQPTLNGNFLEVVTRQPVPLYYIARFTPQDGSERFLP
jgi:hypothetical protein